MAVGALWNAAADEDEEVRVNAALAIEKIASTELPVREDH